MRNSVCSTVNKNVQVRKIVGYDVGHEFGKEILSSPVDSNPGSTIRIRVSATPIEQTYSTILSHKQIDRDDTCCPNDIRVFENLQEQLQTTRLGEMI